MTVSAVQSNSSQHISELVREQKPPKGGRTSRPNAVAPSRMRAPHQNYQNVYQPHRMQRNTTTYPNRQPAASQPIYQHRSVATRQFSQPPTASRLHQPAVTANASNRQQTQNAPADVKRTPLISQKPTATSNSNKRNDEIIVISSDDSGRPNRRPPTTQQRPTGATPPRLATTSLPHATSAIPPKTSVARHRPRPADTIPGSSSDEDCHDRPRRPIAHAGAATAAVPVTQIRRPFDRRSSPVTLSIARADAAAAVPSRPTQSVSSSSQSSSSHTERQQPPIVSPTPITSITVPALSTAVRLVHINDTSDALGGAALPQLQDDDPMFMSDLPDFVAKFGTKVAPARLPDGLAANSRIQLYVTEVNNPTKFWFHVQDDNHPLDVLMFQLE